MSRYLILFSLVIISFYGIEQVNAIGYPYVDPVREYYDSRQSHSLIPSPPVYYDGFFVDSIIQAECDSWVPVYGIAPDEGLLFFTIISGDYLGFTNVSHNTSYYLMNYFYLPCTGTDHAQLNVTYIWNDNDDQEYYPNTKVKGIGIDQHFIQLSQTFRIR